MGKTTDQFHANLHNNTRDIHANLVSLWLYTQQKRGSVIIVVARKRLLSMHLFGNPNFRLKDVWCFGVDSNGCKPDGIISYISPMQIFPIVKLLLYSTLFR